FDVSLTLPAEWTVTDVLVNQQRITWETVPQEAGVHMLRIPFDNPLPADQPAIIQLSAHLDPKDWPLEEGSTTFPLPEVRVLQSNAVEGAVVVAAERDLDVQPQDLKGLAPTLLDPALSARLSYEYQDTHYSGKILVLRKPTRISARTLAFHRLDKETFLSHLEARLTVEGGGVRKLLVSLPESAGTNLRFELAGGNARIVEQTTDVPADGRRIWTLELDQRAYGEILLLVDVSQPRKDAKEFAPPAMQLIGAERETGQIAFEAEPDQQLDIVAKDAAGVALADVDPTDLTVSTGYDPKERIVAAYSYVLPGYQLKLTERRFARMAVPTAICDHLNLVSILGETGELQHEATFQIRAVGVQSLQVTLPEKAQLWATLLDDAPIEVRRTKTAYLIPLKANAADPNAVEDPSRVRTLKLYYRTEVGPLTAAGSIRQTPPGISVLNGDGTQQPLEILQQIWTVHHPEQTEFVADPGSFIASEQHLRLSVLGDLLRSFQVDSPRNLFWKAVTLIMTTGIIWVLGMIWRRSGAKGLFALTIVLFFGAFISSFLLLITASEAPKSALGPAGTVTVTETFHDSSSLEVAAAPKSAFPTANSQFGDAGQIQGPERNLPTPVTAAPGSELEDLKKLDEMQADTAAVMEKAAEDAPAEAKPADLSQSEGVKKEGGKKSSKDGLLGHVDSNEQSAIPFDDRAPIRNKNPGFIPRRQELAQQAAQPGAPGKPQDAANGQKPAADDPFQPPPPGQQPVGAAPKQPVALGLTESISGKAVLSLALSLEPPAGSRSATYTYRGRLQKMPPELVISYQNRARLSFVMLVVQMVVILICWFSRQRALAVRGLILALGIGVPLALMTVVPEASLPFLDGVLGGTVLGAVLWMIIALCQWLSSPQLWNRLNSPLVTSVAILLVLSCSSLSVWAAEKPEDPSAAKQRNQVIAEKIAKALRTAGLTGYAIEVEFKEGNATLIGKVPTTNERDVAIEATRGVTGVLTIVNRLTIEEPSKSDGDPKVARPGKAIQQAAENDDLVIPFDTGTDPLKSNRVFIPYSKFVELYRQAHPEEPEVKNSPVGGTISEALYAAELIPAAAGKKAAIKVTGRFACYSFRDSQVTLPLPLGKVAVVAAQVDGTAAPLVPWTDLTPLAVVISKPGLHVVDLQFTVPVQLTGPAGVFSLALTEVPSGLMRFKVPAGELNFRVNGSSGAFRRVGKDAAAELLIPVAAGGAFQVSWQPRQNRADVAGVVHVESTSAFILSEEGPRLLSHWIYQVRQGSLAEVSFSLPEELGVRKIEGEDVGGWEVGGEGEARQLKIFLRRKVEDATHLKFDLFLKQAADDLETTYVVPQFAPQNITRETGTLAVLAEKQFSVRVGDISGLAQIEPQQVPLARLGELSSSPTLAYRFANRPYQLQLVVGRRQPQLKVTGRHFAQVDPRKIQQQNRFQFRLTGAPRASVTIILPQGYLLQDVQAPEVAEWHISGREDSADMDAEAMLHLEFAAPRVGNFDVVVTGKTLRQPDNLKAEVSLPYPLETDELDTQLLTTLDAIYTGSATMLDNWKSIDPAELARLFVPGGTAPNQLGFSSQAPAPAPVAFDLHQALPRLSGQVLSLVTVEEDSLEYLFALQWNISTAGADSFVFTTPEWLAGKLDFPEGNGPRRRGVTQEPTGDGRTRWTITLEDPQRERYFIVARAVLPPSAKGEVTAPGFVLEQVLPGQDPPQINPLETQTQFVVLVNQSQTQLTSVAPDSVETIPAEDLTRAIKIRQDLIDQAAEIVRVRTVGAGVVWKQQRFQAEQLLPAAVNLAHHVTVLAPDGSWREQVTYRMRNRKRQFLAVKLPEGSQVLSLFVKGQPARPVLPAKATGYTLIPLPKTVEGDLSFDVQLVLAGQLSTGPLPRNWGLSRQQIDIPIPSVVSPEESAEYGIAVSQTTWTLYAPKDLDIDVLKRSSLTNVNEVTETLQQLDQTVSVLNDAAELIAVNSNTYNRRAQAQSLNNLKQLGPQLKALASTSIATNSAELAKQQELQKRATQLEQSITRLFITNNEQGLSIQDDGAGNTTVIDQRGDKSGQKGRISEFYADNPNAVAGGTLTSDVGQLVTPEGGKVPKGQKGNVDRDNLRGQNQSQVRELAAEQQKRIIVQEEEGELPNGEAQSKPKSYEFAQPAQNFSRIAGPVGQMAQPGQMVNGPGSGTAPFPAGPPRDLNRRGDYPKLGTIVGQERQLQFSNDLQVPYRNPNARLDLKGGTDQTYGIRDGVNSRGLPLDGVQAEQRKQSGRQRGTKDKDELKDRKEEGFLGQLDSVEWSAIPFDDRNPIAYGKNWQELARGRGGMGMGGGGLGGMGGGGNALPGWTASGGLSLLIEIPTDGKVYSFSKLSGGAKLGLAVRPHQTWQFALGLVWTLTWLIILVVIAWTLSRPRAVAALCREAPWILAALGLVTFFLVRSGSGAGMALS
ncbi:MAG: hypothetical protein JWN70_5916, partial [Planctomycetaceae bacterium]|nr:hypothetical protein [Planctomycetaceae bacterium]